MSAATALSFTALHADMVLVCTASGNSHIPFGSDQYNQCTRDLITMGFLDATAVVPTDICYAAAMMIRAYARREVAIATENVRRIKHEGYIA
jgi:hypothetical protein